MSSAISVAWKTVSAVFCYYFLMSILRVAVKSPADSV